MLCGKKWGIHPVNTFIRTIATQSEMRNKMIQRICQNNNSANSADSSWKLWWSHLRGSSKYTKLQLQSYQNMLMTENVDPNVTVLNTLIPNGINQWHYHNKSVKRKTPILLIHGYASSSVSFFNNAKKLATRYSDVYAIDLPGNGLSRELKFDGNVDTEQMFNEWLAHDSTNQFELIKKYDNMLAQKSIHDSEDYYVNSMEQWRNLNKIEKFHLVGHSFGGYISYKYAKKFPNVVNKLCLISPLGMERNIHSINNNFSCWDVNSVIDVELKDPSNYHYTRKFNIPKYLFYNQFRVLRKMGPLGAKICYNYINNAYSRVPSDQFKRYMFTLFYGKNGITPTAICIFNNLFTRNLLARDPIMDTINNLSIDKILFVYGQHDWMNKVAGLMTTDCLNSINNKYTCQYVEVPHAGHNLFLDNPKSFNESILSFLED